MAIALSAKQNVTAPGGDYPYGDIKDNDGTNNGTPVNRAVYADFHQFFARLLDQGGVTANGLPDNSTNTFQYFLALIANIRATFATESARGTAEIATTAETNTGTDDARIVTPLKLAGRTATESRTGIAEIATTAEVNTGTDDARFVTPLKLSQAVTGDWTFHTIDAAEITAAGATIANESGFFIYRKIGKTVLFNLLLDFDISGLTGGFSISVDVSAILTVINDGFAHRYIAMESTNFEMLNSNFGANTGVITFSSNELTNGTGKHIDCSGAVPIQ